MLLLCIFLLSGCLSGSMGSAIEEFQVNFKVLVDLASKEIFLPVPGGKFQMLSNPRNRAGNRHVPCQLERTIERLKFYFRNDQMRTHVSLMEKNVEHIISTLNTAHTRPEKDDSCPKAELSPQNALKRYQRFFQKLQEMC